MMPPLFTVGDKFLFRGLPVRVTDRTYTGYGDFRVGDGDIPLEVTGITMTGDLLITSDNKPGSVPLNVARTLVQDGIWTRVRDRN